MKSNLLSLQKMKIGVLTLALASGLTSFAETATASEHPPVRTVDYVDLNRYVGKWFEIASIPQSFQKQCVANTTSEYSFADRDLIKVYNSCEKKDGTRSAAEGRAKVKNPSTNAELKVTFVKLVDWAFLFGGNYWILDLAQDYSYALVGDPTAKYAWILARTPSVSPEFLAHAESVFKSNGYDTCQILTSIQTDGATERTPLCRLK